jgi:uncharacterized protein involved in cysteine biosynthesis
MKMNMKKLLGGLLISFALSGLTFWAIFFKFTPWLIKYIGNVPNWGKVLIYAGIGWFGGIGIPFCILVGSCYITFTISDK